MGRPIYTASGEVIYGETPEDGIVAKVYGDPELADLMARAVNNYDALIEALRCAVAQLEADQYPDVAAEMFGSELDPAKAMSINRYDVAEMGRAALAQAKETE